VDVNDEHVSEENLSDEDLSNERLSNEHLGDEQECEENGRLHVNAGPEGPVSMGWNDERVETLKRLWADGLSASQIAAELGGITRNAVIGKVHRLGLAARAKSPTSTTPRPRKARANSQMIRVNRPAVRGNTALAAAFEYDTEIEPEQTDNVVPMGQRRNLLELTEDTCRWPIGDPGNPDFFFCGGQAVTALPYCAHHCRVAYQPANPRRDRKPQFR
jgi:GcrA cell cycle regulator